MMSRACRDVLVSVVLSGACASAASAVDVAWMRPGVRVWYLGAVDGGGATSSNAEEAYLIAGVSGTTARVIHHAALTHWTAPRPVESTTHSLVDQGPCWMHPARLQTITEGEAWREPDQTITLVQRLPYTYDTFPYHTLPIKALFAVQAQRQIVKLTYMIPYFSTGTAYFDAETGLLLYQDAVWDPGDPESANKLFFMLAEINYDFAAHTPVAEDEGPHTGFRSFASEQSLGSSWFVGGGSVVIQSLFETRYGPAYEMRVFTTIGAPGAPAGTGQVISRDENYCFFGDVPILRRLNATQAPNLPPEQWNAFGQHLWWWLPANAQTASVNVYDVPMARSATFPLTFTASQTPQRFHFTMLQLDANGYLTAFSAKDPTSGLDLKPTDQYFQNANRVDGRRYFRTIMAPRLAASPRSDFDSDRKADPAVYRPATGTWFALDSSTNHTTYRQAGWGMQDQGDRPVRADFDGDGVVDPTVYRPASGTWFILHSSTGHTTWDWFGWGNATDTLVPGDYDGDGKTDAAVYRASEHRWYVRPSSGATPWNVVFGEGVDIPVPGDYDGDGRTDVAVYRPASGTWFVLTSSSNRTAYYDRGWGVEAQGDTPVPADYDGDGKTDVAVYRPGPGTWFILKSSSNDTDWSFDGWGNATDTPVPADFDMDGKADLAVYRASEGRWYVKPSSGATTWNKPFGEAGDVPLLRVR